MDKYYKEILHKLEEDIRLLEIEAKTDDFFQRIENIIAIIVTCLSEMKKHVIDKGFKNTDFEILFFKHQKPAILAKLIYYNAIYKIEAKKPNQTKAIRKYLNEELKNLKRYFDNNLEFYTYFRTNSTYLDHKYFLRGKHDIKLSLETFYFETDHCFTTSYDYKVANIIANDLIQVYLENQIYTLPHQNKSSIPYVSWTGSKTALTELIYSLNAQGVFDNGNADIKLIAKAFEISFNIDLGDFYHTFMDLKFRKINRTKFLDSLRDVLIKKMDDDDERMS